MWRGILGVLKKKFKIGQMCGLGGSAQKFRIFYFLNSQHFTHSSIYKIKIPSKRSKIFPQEIKNHFVKQHYFMKEGLFRKDFFFFGCYSIGSRTREALGFFCFLFFFLSIDSSTTSIAKLELIYPFPIVLPQNRNRVLTTSTHITSSSQELDKT